VRRGLAIAGAVLAIWGAGGGAKRVFELESREIERAAERTLAAERGEDGAATRRRLLVVPIDAGADVLFEVCARDGLPERWEGAVDFVVRDTDRGETVVSAPLDHRLLARAQRSAEGACLVLGSGKLEVRGRYAIDAEWPDRTLDERLARVPLRARILASHALDEGDGRHGLSLLAGILLIVLAAVRWRPDPDAESDSDPRTIRRMLVGVGALGLAMIVLAFLPFWGSLAGLARGGMLVTVEICAAVLLMRGSRTSGLALVAPLGESPSRTVRIVGWVSLALAPAVGFGLWVAAGVFGNLVPSTEEAGIEALASFPSGALSVGLVAILAPVAEEIFFRGMVYGLAERRLGRVAAFAIAVGLFAIAHLPQQWGAWGAFLSVTLVGVVLTALRAATRTTLVPIVAHLVHNLVVALLVVG